MQINAIFDASAADAPAGFETAVQAAISYLESVIATPITVTIQFGWGEIGGQPMGAGALGESLPYGSFFTYAQVRSALMSVASDSDETTSAATLPASDPTNGGQFFVTTAEQRALGLLPADYNLIDGYVGLDSTASYTFDPSNRAVSGEYDAIGILEHEITEVLGRDADLGEVQTNATNIYSPMDLFRYASSGVRDLTPAAGSFSINGTTLLDQWNNPLNGGDGGDWASSVVDDSFDAFATPGVELSVSATDLRLLDILGFHPTAPTPAAPPATPTPSVGASTPITVTEDTTVADGVSVYFPFSAAATDVTGYALSGAASLTDDGTITVISSAAAGGIGVSGSAHGGLFQTAAGSALYVEATASGAQAIGFEGGAASPSVTDGGHIQVVSALGSATGIETSDSTAAITINTGGVLTVWGTAAVGVDLANGGAFSNDGSIQVSGVTPIGVEGASSFTNAGSITATGVNGGGGGAIGVDITEPSAGGPVLSTLTNSGTITADTAINIDASAFPDITINNSGKVNGAISLANGNDTINNTGTIVGDVYFGDGNSVYSGAGGTLTGAIYLGFGTNSVTLGAGGGTVYGGFGSDTIIGGSGNDVFEIGGGNNNITGGSGFNVLSFADSPTAVTVDLATGTATDDGTDTIKNIQEVIGSQVVPTIGVGDTLQAGSAPATLIAGVGLDTLIAGSAADTLVAGSGGGTMVGGAGGDTFIYSIGDQVETVDDFTTGDVLKIYGYASAEAVIQQGTAVTIQLSEQDEIILQNTTLSQLNATDVVYNSGFYPGLALPASPPPRGTNPIFIEQNLTITAGDTISEQGEAYGLVNEGHSLNIEGTVSVSFPVQTLTDIVYGWIDNNVDQFGNPISPSNDTLVLGDDATLTVSDLEGGAVGFAPLFANSLSNAGKIIINAGGAAWGVQAPSSVFNYTSQVGSYLNVTATGQAFGLQLGDGGEITNSGQISVMSSTANAYGVQIDQAQGQTLTNNSIASIGGSTRGSAQGFGVMVGGSASGGAFTINNAGTIGGQTAAIAEYNDGGNQLPELVINNSGTISGAIDLEAAVSSLVNTGTIDGDIILQDDSTGGTGTPGYLVNLSGGTLSGQIQISPGSVGNVAVADTIDTGAGSTVITVAGGESNLDLTVKGLASGQTTIDLSIASSQASLIHDPNGEWSVNAGTDGTFFLTNVETLQFSDKSVHLPEGQPAAEDFTGDGVSGILFQGSSGGVAFWEMNGTNIAGGGTIGNPGGTWAEVGTGDFTGDGKTDIVFQDASGNVAIWEMNGTSIVGGGNIGNPGGTWHVAGVGDFNGADQSDILFQDASGNLAIWEMNGTSIIGGGNIGNPGGTWQVKGVGDFYGAGMSDILFQDSAGDVAIWEMNGTNIIGGGDIGNPGGTWHVEGAGDFYGNGRSDILFENASGEYAIWEMNGTSIVGGGNIGDPGGTWSFAGIGDYTGNGNDGILFVDASGNLAIWEMNGTSIVGGGNIGNPGSAWHVFG